MTDLVDKKIEVTWPGNPPPRGLKPANLLVTGGGVPKLLDFGIAKHLDECGKTLENRVLREDIHRTEAIYVGRRCTSRLGWLSPLFNAYHVRLVLDAD